ncbi:MAG: glucosaminidase domain-containing protein [Bacilli bacterium]|nr:glucosaminidase domain-containing protein [Bacilli bacterium]
MKKIKLISSTAMLVGILMISLGFYVQSTEQTTNLNSLKIEEFDVKNMATSVNKVVKDNNKEDNDNFSLTEIDMETAPASVLRVEVFQGMTMEELSKKLDKSLGGILAGHGKTIAEHSLKVGVDPYIVTAIMMHETGNGTSRIANSCYNFGGQKGSGCGAYKRYGSVDEGLRGMIDNLYNNYYAHGLKTVEAIGPRYAESSSWVGMINWYIGKIKTK